MTGTRRSRRPAARSPRPKPHRSAAATALEGLSAIIEHLDEVLYVVRFPAGDLFRGTVQFVSGRAQAITGCEPKEFVEDSGLWSSLLHPDDLPALQATTQTIVETRRPAVREYRLRNRATGEYRRIEDRVAPLLDAGGNVAGMVGAARDVTQRVVAEERLRTSEARLQAIFDNSLDAILLFDNQARLVDVNPAALQRLGYTPDERATLNAWDLVPAEKRQEAEQLWRRLLTEGSLNGDYVARREDGSIRQVEYRAVANILPGLNLAVARDVTERKLAERALEARAQQQAVVASLGHRAVAERDLPSFLDAAVRAVAETVRLDFSGVLELLPESGELLLRAGVGWAEGLVGHATVVPLPGTQAHHVLNSGEPVVVDLACETRFTPHPLLIEHGAASGVCVAIHGPETPLGVLCAYTRERRVFATDEIHFLQSVANVLAAAIVHARDERARGQLLERVISAQEEERRRIARELHDETAQAVTSLLVGLRSVQEAPTLRAARERAAALRPIVSQTVEDVGGLARRLHPSVLDDLGLVPALRRYCGDHPGLRALDVGIDAGERPPRLPAQVETALYRIAQEALTNVVRHASARRVHIALARGESFVELRVEDDGIGFDAQAVLHAGPPRGRLGLVGIRERVAFLGGSFTLRSEPGKGAAVIVRCPLAEA